LGVDGKLAACAVLADEIRPEARPTITALKTLGVKRIVMLTGDNEKVAKRVADSIGITTYHANLLPEDKLKYIKERYKEDPQRLAEEQAALMRTQGLSTLAGCLPLLLQFPIFIILQRVLSSSIELYKAPFFGWITDLSAVDPWYILPILTTLAMLLSMTATDARQRLFSVAMAVVFGAISTTFSAGLVLYIFVSTAFGVVQSFIQRKLRA